MYGFLSVAQTIWSLAAAPGPWELILSPTIFPFCVRYFILFTVSVIVQCCCLVSPCMLPIIIDSYSLFTLQRARWPDGCLSEMSAPGQAVEIPGMTAGFRRYEVACIRRFVVLFFCVSILVCFRYNVVKKNYSNSKQK